MPIDTSTGLQYGDTNVSSYYTNILQDYFLPAMADVVIYPNTLLSLLPRDSRRVEGKQVIWPAHYDDANGVNAIGAGGLLPDPDTEKFAKYATDIKHIYVRMKFDGIQKDAAKTRKASWVDTLMFESEAKAKILARQRQRMYWNDGSGRLAEVVSPAGGAMAATTYTLRINQGIESPTTCSTAPTRWIKVGMILAFVESTGALESSGTIKGVAKVLSKTATTVTLDTPLSISGVIVLGDYVVAASQVVAGLLLKDTAFRREPMGLSGIFADADPADGTANGHQGIDSDSATYDWHRANVLSNSAVLRPLTLDLMDLAWTTPIENRDTVPELILTSFALVRNYAKLLLVDRRYVGETTYDGGYKGLDYNGAGVIADRDCYNNRMLFACLSDLTMNVMADPQWMNEDGSIYSRLQERDEYQAAMFCREQLAGDIRNKQTIVTDLQE